jgi:hypothetical protein
LQSKFTKSANESKKKFVLKNLIWVYKNAEFHADFESVEKMHQKKVISKNVTEICTFSLLLMFVKIHSLPWIPVCTNNHKYYHMMLMLVKKTSKPPLTRISDKHWFNADPDPESPYQGRSGS